MLLKRILIVLSVVTATSATICTPERTQYRRQDAPLFLVKIGGKCGYIDKAGKIAIQPQFFLAKPFSEGLAAVYVGAVRSGSWGFIDKSGTLVIKPQFGQADSFSEGMAKD